jgi:hypothetical protein
VKRKIKKNDENHGNALLTNEEELRIVGYMRACEVMGVPLTKSQSVGFIKAMHFKTKPKWNGNSWFKSFRSRHKSLISLKNTKQSGKSRIGEDKHEEMKV